MHFVFHDFSFRYANNYYGSYNQDIQVSEQSTNIRYLEHVVLTVSLSISLGPNDNSYDYSDLYEHYSQLRDQKEFDDFEDFLDDNRNTRNKRENEYEWLTADHARRGDIKVELISPMGTKSVLLPYREFDFVNAEGYDSWPFMSLHHWGENPIGNWIVQVTYNNIHAMAYVRIEKFEIYGTSVVPEAISQIPIQCDPGCDRGCSGIGADNCDVCSVLRDSQTLQCVNECPENITVYNNYCINVIYSSFDGNSNIPSFVLPLAISLAVIIIVVIVVASLIIVGVYVCINRRKRRSAVNYNVIPVEDL